MLESIPFLLFNLLVIALLLLDLFVFNRKDHEIKIKEALAWSAFWIILALTFGWVIYLWRGQASSLEYFAGYLVEKSLSADNVFVFIMIFSYFHIPKMYQHKILFWGIVGALVMRGIFIFLGVALIAKFHWLLYILGLFLIYLGLKIIFRKETEIHPEKNPVLRLFHKIMPFSQEHDGGSFFVRRHGKLCATPLFVALLVVETTDVIFAVDSIPAVMAITLDPFIIYTSNVFAILGLRALYFALAGLMSVFSYLHYGIGIILTYVGVKMLISKWYAIPVGISLGIIGLILLSAVLLSIIKPPKKES
jgi:tellurite resistance protein TerC